MPSYTSMLSWIGEGFKETLTYTLGFDIQDEAWYDIEGHVDALDTIILRSLYQSASLILARWVPIYYEVSFIYILLGMERVSELENVLSALVVAEGMRAIDYGIRKYVFRQEKQI